MPFINGQKGNIANYERFHLIEIGISYKTQINDRFRKEKPLIAEYFTLLSFLRDELTTWWRETVHPCTCKGNRSKERLWEEYVENSQKYVHGGVDKDFSFEKEVSFTHLVPKIFTEKQKDFLKAKKKLVELSAHLLTT